MKTLLAPALVALLVFTGFTSFTQDDDARKAAWTVDKAHSQVTFQVRHLGITKVNGNFSQYDVTLDFDPADLTTLKTTATIDVASIDTGIDRRDGHLRSDDFFNAEQYPQMTFVSKRVQNVDGDQFEVVGDLTIRDVTKEVVLDAELLGTVDAMGKKIAAFTAETTINRLEYGLKWNRLTEAGGAVVSQDVKIMIDIEAAQE